MQHPTDFEEGKEMTMHGEPPVYLQEVPHLPPVLRPQNVCC